MFRKKTRIWKTLALATTLLLLACSTMLLADDTAGGLDGETSTFYSWFASIQEWIIDALLGDPAPEDETPAPPPSAPEDQPCQASGGCAEQFPTPDPNG